MKGHIYKRGKTYTYVIDLGKDPFTSKRQQKTKGGFKTKKEAAAALAEIQTEYNRNDYIEESDISFKECCKKWLDGYKKGLYSSGTIPKISSVRVRKYDINRMENFFKDIKLKNITTELYQTFLFDMLNNNEYNTLLNTHRSARMIFKSAINNKTLKDNPTDNAVVPKKQLTVEELENRDNVPKYLEKEDLYKFLELVRQSPEPQLYTAFLTLAYTGMRIGELCALKWKDIDLINGEISIYKTIYCPNKTVDYVIIPPKTKGSVRTIDIDKTVIDTLKKHKAYQNEFRLRISEWHKEDFVFTKYFRNPGYPETTKQLELKFSKLIELGKFKKLTPHALRHTHVSLLAEAGVRLEEIMERLGHNDDKTTRNIYLHVTKVMKKEASQKFEQFMKSF